VKNKVIIITGASSGIGKALATEFAKLECKVVIAGRNKDNLTQTYNELKLINDNIHQVVADVSVEDDCKKLIESTINRFEQIDVLINNAGISMRALFETLDLKVIKSLMDTNFWGTVFCTKYALPWILKTKGSIVAVSSIAGFAPLPARTGYSASKYAIHGFLNTLRVENLHKGLHVLIAAPGFTASNIRKTALVADGSQQGETPKAEEKLMSAEKVASCIVKAIKNRKRTLFLTTQGKLTVLLYKFFPTFTDKLIFNHMVKEPNSPLKY